MPLPADPPKSLADALFGKTRKAVISRLYGHPERSWHLRELAREANLSPTMLSKEADKLAGAGILLDVRDGNRRELKANPSCPIYEELRGIARKTSGLADILRETLSPLKGIDQAFIFGSVARGKERSDSDVDVCVIGSVANRTLVAAVGGIEEQVRRPVSVVLYTIQELREKIRRGNPFVTRMLSSEKLFLIGDANGLIQKIGKP
jgi:predicted nucleotidyltransferase